MIRFWHLLIAQAIHLYHYTSIHMKTRERQEGNSSCTNTFQKIVELHELLDAHTYWNTMTENRSDPYSFI